MKRTLLVLGVALALAGCGGGGGGGSSTPTVPGNPGNPGNPTPAPTNTPISTATNAPSTVVVAATSSPFAIVKTAINPASTSTNGGALTVTGTGMNAGAALYATVSSNDKSGSTCLELIPQGQTSGTPCSYPAAGSTPAPVGVTHSGDQVAVQYNNGATPPTGAMNITVTANGGTGPLTPFSMNYPAPAIGATGNGTVTPWGGGIAFLNNNIYFTTNSASQPIGYVSYSNGTVGGAISYLTASSNLKNAPAGGLVAVGNTLYGTEQNSSEAFSITTSGSVTKYSLTCPSSGTAGSGSALVYPQTGITTDGSNVFVLCGAVATRTDTTHNTVNEISSTGTVTFCQLNSAGGNTAGPFANGAVYANGVIYSETSFGSSGGGAGGATGGDWIAIPVNPLSNCGNFKEMGNAAITGSGNVWLQPDKNLYSETDNLMAAPAAVGFGSATAGSPTFANGGIYMGQGGGGLAMDGVLGSGFFVGTADRVDAIIHTKWSGGTAIVPNTFLPLSSGGTPISVGQCEVAYNAGGGMGAIQLPDGKFAWPHATDGDPAAATQNWLCVLNP